MLITKASKNAYFPHVLIGNFKNTRREQFKHVVTQHGSHFFERSITEQYMLCSAGLYLPFYTVGTGAGVLQHDILQPLIFNSNVF